VSVINIKYGDVAVEVVP